MSNPADPTSEIRQAEDKLREEFLRWSAGVGVWRDCIAAIDAFRAASQREAFEAGWDACNDCDVWADSVEQECAGAFAAWLTRQAGQPSS